MKHLLLLITASLLTINLAVSQELASQTINTTPSSYNMEETLSKLRTSMKDIGVNIMAEVDHAKAATKNGLELRPTHVFIFGNPQVGTNLMQADQRAGLDLPLRLLVWEDEKGQVNLGYHSPKSLHNLYELKKQDAVLIKIALMYEKLSEVVKK
ncbi:DUF302 domain-containing protein [uncultured Pontibacter sp.]|uniref:DUF302 domain-containing protein n=1 Tax=uncultured Pontibacter sp. TaxID=453356 RepID=UPI0026330A8C|nr:DUF302 domain-containing protein [uncultured Pontibacter sp.]